MEGTRVPSVRASRNYFDPWTSSVANRIYLWVYNESRYRTRISIEENSFISGSAISSNHLVVCFREEEFDFMTVKYSRWISERDNGLEIRRSVFLPVEIHARRFPVSTTSPYRPRKLGATGDTYSWCLAQGMHDYEFDPLHTIV